MSPIEQVQWDGTAWVGAGNYVPEQPVDPFEVGVTEPTTLNTGFRVPEISLDNYSGDITNVSEGETLRELLITGQVKISGNRNAKFVDCLTLGTTDPTPTATGYYNHADHTFNNTGIIEYEFCEFRGLGTSYRQNGVKGKNVKLYRCKGSGFTDFLSPHGSSGAQFWGIFHAIACFSEDFNNEMIDPNQVNTDGITHPDNCQAAGLITDLLLDGNSVGSTGRPWTSNVLLQTGQGSYGTVVIRRNWFRGHSTNGSTVNVPISASTFQSFAFYENRVSTVGKTPRVLLHSTVRSTFAAGIYGNVELETGNPVTINSA